MTRELAHRNQAEADHRSGGKQGLDVPFHSLLPMDVKAYQESECPLCQQGVPVVKPGSRTPKS